MVDHVPCYDWLARDKPCSETWENIPRHKLAEQTIAQLLGDGRAAAANALVTSWLSWSRWQCRSWSSLQQRTS
jgi:hypothetical protein